MGGRSFGFLCFVLVITQLTLLLQELWWNRKRVLWKHFTLSLSKKSTVQRLIRGAVSTRGRRTERCYKDKRQLLWVKHVLFHTRQPAGSFSLFHLELNEQLIYETSVRPGELMHWYCGFTLQKFGACDETCLLDTGWCCGNTHSSRSQGLPQFTRLPL